jgi:hypothetical protein
MGRRPHPLRDRAVQLMRGGLATPGEIAEAEMIDADLVRNWRQREGINSHEARIDHVRRLMRRQPRTVPVIEDPDAAPY